MDSATLEKERTVTAMAELMKQDLCGACLAQVRADHAIKLLTRGVGNKITCDKCGRRRYGGTYEVTKREDKR